MQKGDALVKLEVKITDAADHTETITRTCPVSDQAVRVSLLPEGGRITPGLENRVFAAAIYPDGGPAQCDVKLWLGKEAKGKPFASLKTNEAGLAEFRLTPKAEQFRPGEWGQKNLEMLGGRQVQTWSQQNLLDLYAEAADAKGATAKTAVALNGEPLGENVLLRLDKAIYKPGEAVQVDVRSSAGLPTVYLDVVRSGQTVLTQWLDVKDGKANYALDLPQSLFGTVEIHAYQMLASGEIIRDGRVVYVQPANDLKIDVQADRDVYLPGAEGKITFRVTGADGKPAVAALGVLVVDEAVYALQEMQPGLEKVYFTLQEELLKPQAQVLYKPSETVETLVRQPALSDGQQQIAEALLTAVKPKPPARWEVNPAVERRQKLQGQLQQIGWALYNYALTKPVLQRIKEGKTWSFKPGLLKELVESKQLNEAALMDPLGDKLTLETIAKIEKEFSAERLGTALTHTRIWQVRWSVVNFTNNNQAKYVKDGKWSLPATVLADAAKAQGLDATWLKDAWGGPLKLVKLDKKRADLQGMPQFEEYDVASAGPDGAFGTDDDVKLSPASANPWRFAQIWWDEDMGRNEGLLFDGTNRNGAMLQKRGMIMEGRFDFARAKDGEAPMALPAGAAFGGGAGLGGFAKEDKKAGAPSDHMSVASGPAGAAAPTHLREYFPETLLWNPSLITDDQGRAELPLTFADSITTWRLTASASSQGGALGGVDKPLRVFQDFFADIDLPVALTQNDEVSFPVAVYNYLKNPQTVKVDLQQEEWFAVVDGKGLSRTLDLKPNEVASVKFRIRASRIGRFALTVKASGSKMSDAVKRQIDVAPDGKLFEQAYSDRLNGHVAQTVFIPDNALADASKILVKIHPGVFSQVLEGADGILRMPGGCFEQTSSSAYPNVLTVDHLKKTHTQSPAVMMKAEQYLNAGYQRLLTFEHKTGGFDWWGQESNEPLIWLSAYGLQEFNDMSKVYPVDHGVIDRTQAWLMKQQAADGTWDKIGATHSETIAAMGDPKLLLTSYVAWALLDSGLKAPGLEKSIGYIRDHAKESDNAYVLALAANALASWDAKDDSTHDVLVRILKKLDAMQQPRPEWQAVSFPAKGQSMAYARGESLTIETTALTVLAMLKSGQFPNDVNKALVYLVKSKDPSGTWGSTSATILSLKALITASGGAQQKGTVGFTLAVNGKQAAKGEITEQNADVMQVFDLKEFVRPGANEVTLDVKGETGAMYQIVGRHYEPWAKEPPAKPLLEVAVDYDRTHLSTADVLEATAVLKYHGKEPTAMVMLDLGVPPGFTADAGDFAEMVGAKKIQKFSLTERQAILYLGDVEPNKEYRFKYTLKPKYPVKAKTPVSTAFEYYTPGHRAEAAPVELVVEEPRK